MTPTHEQLRELKAKLAEHDKAQRDQFKNDEEGYGDGICHAIVIEQELKDMAVECLPALIAAAEENARLRTLLNEAADEIDGWGQYAGDYFQEKWDLKGTVQKYRDAALAKAAGEGA